MAENVVRVSGLTKTFGKNTVLSNVNISLERGKIYGFIGQNRKDYPDQSYQWSVVS